MSVLIKIPVVLLSVLITACATFKPDYDSVTDRSWPQRRQLLESMVNWQFDGRVAIKAERGSGKMGVRWLQQGDQFDIKLLSMFGQQLANISGAMGGPVTLIRPDRDPLSAETSAELMANEMNWYLPLDGLRYWVLGVPVPGYAARITLDGWNRLGVLDQDGWRIEYTDFQSVDGVSLPRKLRLIHPLLSAKLILDQWRLDKPDYVHTIVAP